MQPLRLRSGLNVEKQEIVNNILKNINSVPWLDRQLGSGELCLVGGGPSLACYLDKIREMQAKGAKVMALNNAHDYLISHGIKVDYGVLLDARQANSYFYTNPDPDTEYLIASQAHPDVFKALSGHKVRLWHSALGDEARSLYKKAALDKGIKTFAEIGGGCTVGLRACYLAYAVGFKDLHLFGYDSSHEGYHHAYRQDLNDDCNVIEVMVGGQTFLTSPTMAKQAYQFQSTVMRLSRAGVELTVHGGGLLPTIHKEMHRSIDPDDLEAVEARKYSNMWAFDEYRQNAPGQRYIDKAIVLMDMLPSETVIDFGCGTGRAAQQFKDSGYKVTGVDHAANCLDENIDIQLVIANLWKLPNITAKYGYCTDVMEHIPPQKVDEVLACISRSVEKCFFNIHTGHDSMGALIEDTLHLTVQDKEWWLEKLSLYFDVQWLEDSTQSNSELFIGESHGLTLSSRARDAENFKPPHLRFEDSSIKDSAASLEAGRAVFNPCVKVFIRSPGDDKCEVPYIVEQKVKNPLTGVEEIIKPWETHLKEKLHHKFIERQYYDFCMKSITHWKETQQTMVDGTPIGEWSLLSKAECDNMKSLGILSIEQCSQMTEEAMSAYGLGARTLKEKAGNWLTANKNPGQAAEKINALQANLDSAVERAETAASLMGGYEAKIKQLEQMILNQSEKPKIETVTAVDYELMEKEDLIDACKAKGFFMANDKWSKETLIKKLRE